LRPEDFTVLLHLVVQSGLKEDTSKSLTMYLTKKKIILKNNL